MRKDPTEFRKRFAEWKEGGKPYKDGKISDEQYVSIMENVAADNWQQWGDESEDAALTRILNDNAYDYRGYYNDNPGSAANADTHWPDKYKTVWHPTFSNQSKYSGKKSQYNPYGYPGGTWQGELFNPQWYQQHQGTGFYKDGYPKLPKFEGGEEKFKKLRDRNWDTSGPVDVERTDNTTVQIQEPAVPIKRKMAKGVVPQSWVERRQNEQPVIQQGKNYTQRRIEEETKRTWLSDAADIARGAGEGAMFASNFVPFAGEMFSGGRALMNNLRSYLLHPNYKTVYHGSPYSFDVKNAWTATQNDLGFHVAENKATADIMKEHGGVVYKLRIPKEDTQTIDLGRNGANHLSEFFHMKASPKEEYYNFYDTSPGDDFRIKMIRNAGGSPSTNESNIKLYLENPVDLNIRKTAFPNIKMKDQVEADNIVRTYNSLFDSTTPLRNSSNLEQIRQQNQLAADLLSRNGYKVIKYHNANPYEGGGTAYMITDPSVMDVMQKVPTGGYPAFLGSFGGYGTDKLVQTVQSDKNASKFNLPKHKNGVEGSNVLDDSFYKNIRWDSQPLDAPTEYQQQMDYFGVSKETALRRVKNAYNQYPDNYSVYAGSLPEVVVKPDPNSKSTALLTTFYPWSTDYPVTGHSTLELMHNDDKNDEMNGFVTSYSSDPWYNFVTNNCSDATRSAIESATGKKINPVFFTTPGDVKDFVEKELGGKSKYNKNYGYSETVFTIPTSQARKIVEYAKQQRAKRDGAHIKKTKNNTYRQ